MEETDWAARARREATVILAEAPPQPLNALPYHHWLVGVVATAWIQGANYGAHEGIEAMDKAFATLRADLT